MAIANIGLISMKLAVAVLTGSLAVIASLVDSFFDLVGTAFAYFGITRAAKPADTEHLYGHGKMEGLSGLAQSSLIAITAFILIYESVRRIFSPVQLQVSAFDLAAMLVSIAVAFRMAQYLAGKSEQTKSLALSASAANYSADVLQNIAVLSGLALVQLGMPWADPIAAIALSAIMLRVAFSAGKESANELLDVSPGKEAMLGIVRTIREVNGVKSFHHLRARVVDGKIHVDAHLQLDPKIPLKRAHEISHKVHEKILARVKGTKEVLIHIEPEGDVEPGEYLCPVLLPKKAKKKTAGPKKGKR